MSGLIGSAGGGASIDTARGPEDETGGGGGGGSGDPLAIGKFTGALFASEGAVFAYLSDPGLDVAFAAGNNQVDAPLYPTGARTFKTLRVTASNGNGATPYTVTLYKNGAPTAQVVTVPAGAVAGTVFTDAAHPIVFTAGQKFDLRADKTGSADAPAFMSATLDGPASGGGGGGGGSINLITSSDGSLIITSPAGPTADLRVNEGASWLSTQLTRAQAMLPRIDSPLFFTDFPYNPGQSVSGIDIEYGFTALAGGTVAQSAGFPSGVIACDCGPNATANAYVFAAPNNPFPLVVNPSGTPFYACSRVRIQGAPSTNGQRFLIGMFESVLSDYVLLGEYNGGLSLQLRRASGTPLVVGAGTADFSNAHDYAIGFDGTTIRGYVDGVAVPGLFLTDLSALPAIPILLGAGALVNIGGGTTPMLVDKIAYLVPSLA